MVMDFHDSEEESAFRLEVRAFIDQHLVGELRIHSDRETGAFGRPIIAAAWQRLLNEKGWVAPSWPKESGGTGWTARERYIFESEMAAARAPRLPAMGLQMCGPVIMKFGTPEQKAFFLPKILSGEHYWCQGYSEPNSGSDLASLQMRAVRDGHDYLLNGSKIWTTFAQYANWIFLLVRTSSEGRPQAGITFLLATLDSPGISIRPLISVSGDHEVNQVFFDNVRVPVSNRVGEENGGWTVAKYLLQFERGVGHQVPALAVELAKLRKIAQQENADDGGPLWEDQEFRRRFATLEIESLAAHLTELRLVYSLPAGQNVGDATASLMKISWSETAQEIDELTIEALGAYAVADQHAALEPDSKSEPIGPQYALTAMSRYLNDRVLTIAGGSSEVQRNILARNALHLGP